MPWKSTPTLPVSSKWSSLKLKTRVPTRDIINASRILGDRREVRQLIAFFTEIREVIAGIYWTPALEAWILRQIPPESDARMAYRGVTADNPPVSREVAPGVRVSTIFADIDDFQSKLVACFHSNSNLPIVVMRYATGLRIAPNHPHLPGTAIKLAQHLRRTFDLLPPIDSYSTISLHLEAIDLEFAGAANGKRKYAADASPHRYIRPGAGPFSPAGPSLPPPSHPAPTPAAPPPFWL
eukprot:jgi/Tetstr1/432359/TSEL_021756.t1